MSYLPTLVNFQKQDKAMKLDLIDSQIKQKVVRLLDREGYDLNVLSKKESKKFIIFIDPLSKGLLIWNLVFLLAFYIIQIQISLSLAFGPHFTESQLGTGYKPMYFSLLAVLVIDILLSFFKGYHAFGKGKVIDDGYLVARHYLFTQFFFDLAVVFFYLIPLIHESFALNFLQFIPLILIWIKKSKCQEEVEYILQFNKGVRTALVVFLLLADGLIFGNYGACVFIGMDVLLANAQYYGGTSASNPSEYYWLATNTDYSGYLMNGPWVAQYIYAQFFSTGTLSTLAPGPFARNPIEACYAIFLMIFFMIYASYLADVLVQVVYTYNEGRMIHEENILSFDNFMRIKDVQQSTRLRVFNYFELKWELEFKTQSNQQKIMIDKLPLHLKEQLLQEIGFANELHFLNNMPQSESLKKMISLRIQRSTVDANTCIFQTHKLSNHRRRCLFFIKEGMGKFYTNRGKWDKQQEKPETIFKLTNNDRTLGIYEFITGQDFSICCKSIDLCLLQSLQWNAFMEVLAQLRLQQQFFEIQHRVLVERQLGLINKVCLVCQKNHIETQCPHIHFSSQVQAEVQHKTTSGLNNRRKVKRRQIRCQKKRPQMSNQLDLSNVFGLFKTLNLGKVLTEMISPQLLKEVSIDEAGYFRKYFPEYNIVPRSNAIQQSAF